MYELVLCIPIEVSKDLGDGCKHARRRAGIARARGQAPHSRTHIAIHFTHYHTSHFLNHFLPPAVRPHPAVLLRLSSPLLARYRVLPAYQQTLCKRYLASISYIVSALNISTQNWCLLRYFLFTIAFMPHLGEVFFKIITEN